MKLYIIGISAVVAIALSACGPRCHTVPQEVAYLDENGEVAFRMVDREVCTTPVRLTASDNPVHSGSGSYTATEVFKQKD